MSTLTKNSRPRQLRERLWCDNFTEPRRILRLGHALGCRNHRGGFFVPAILFYVPLGYKRSPGEWRSAAARRSSPLCFV